MENFNFDDGYKTYTINNDPNRTVKLNLGDINILPRLEQGIKNIEEKVKEMQDIDLKADGTSYSNVNELVEAVNGVDKAIREEVDTMLNTNASDAIFGAQSTLSMVGGIQLWERVLATLIPEIKTEVLKQQKQRQKKIDKYVKQVKVVK